MAETVFHSGKRQVIADRASQTGDKPRACTTSPCLVGISIRPSSLEDQREVRKTIDLLTNESTKNGYYCVVYLGHSYGLL